MTYGSVRAVGQLAAVIHPQNQLQFADAQNRAVAHDGLVARLNRRFVGQKTVFMQRHKVQLLALNPEEGRTHMHLLYGTQTSQLIDPPSVPSNGTRSSVPAGSRLLPAESTIKRPAAPACGRFLFTRRQSARSWAYFLRASSTISAMIAALR